MFEILLNNSAIISLVFFFLIFVGIFVWTLLPKNKQIFDSFAEIPLKEDK